MRNYFEFGSLIALLVTVAVSMQQVFQPEYKGASIAGEDSLLKLNTSWQVLGPFPSGMRELPFGGFSAFVASSYEQLFNPDNGARRVFSTYGPYNATTKTRLFEAQVKGQSSDRVKHALTVEYPDVDWPWVRKSAGWSSLQWQMVAVTDLVIARDSTAVAITMDKTAEFAVVPNAAWAVNGSYQGKTIGGGALDWHTGDWYSYIAAFGREGDDSSRLPISHHAMQLDQGSYKLLVRSQYEIRIFGDPRNNDGAESPKMTIGIDIAARSKQGLDRQDLVEVHTDPHHSNVPHVVGGWLAGWGLSLGVRNLDPNETYQLHSVEVTQLPSVASAGPVKAELYSKLLIAPGQTIAASVRLSQTSPLETSVLGLKLLLHLSNTSDPTKITTTKDVQVPLIHKPAFWEASSSDDDHNAYMYSYLANDGTVQMAAATPPKRATRSLSRNGPYPPLILTLHGAGVDIRDLFFSNSIQRQNESWSILPTGRTPWGYDWQLASLQAADAAVAAFHKHLYGLPPTMSKEDKQTWQFDPEKLFVMGHSNGGQGAWYRLTRFPDRAIGGMIGSAYTKVSTYVSFDWKVGRHYTDPALQGILHSGLSMFENDLYASNLAGLDLLIKYGSADANVPPWNSKDMAMVVDGWNRRSGLDGHVKVSEVAGRPHWWDTFFSENDVQHAIEAACSSSQNPGYVMPAVPQSFTLTAFNPAEAGSKGGWRITEVDVPGRLAKLEVRYSSEDREGGALSSGASLDISCRNVRRLELDANILRRNNRIAISLSNSTSLNLKVNGQEQQVDLSNTNRVAFVRTDKGDWIVDAADEAASSAARPIGPILRIVTSKGPIVLIVPSTGPPAEMAAWKRVAQRFAADLLLYAAINSQIFTDTEYAASADEVTLKQSNIVTLGGPAINTFTHTVFKDWPVACPVRFPSPESSEQFEMQGRHFHENGTALLTLAPHPSYAEGMALVVHGIGLAGISRAARLLPTRTGTMIPEWVVVDSTAEWMGEGGVQAAGWYDREWGWSEGMSYVQ